MNDIEVMYLNTIIVVIPVIKKVIETKNRLDSLRLTRYSLLDLMKL